uniref:F-box domain-containing protein n=1 Tax=Leersia perrieri TaxID=77586 RepID=A0A0D9XHM9_9ORYZ
MGNPIFRSLLDPPDLVPTERFQLRLAEYEGGNVRCRRMIYGSRHGRVLLFIRKIREIVVWDPDTGDQRRVAVLPELDDEEKNVFNGAVLCTAAADDSHVHGGFSSCPFKVVLVGIYWNYTQMFACVYSSGTGKWSDLISAQGGCLGIVTLYCDLIQIWERKRDSLNKVLELGSGVETVDSVVRGYAEDNNAVFLSVDSSIFMLQLDSMWSKKLRENNTMSYLYPYTSTYGDDMTRRRRRRQTSPAAAAAASPPDDNDLIQEILLRLPSSPSSLLRASLVCKQWRRLVSDPVFLRRFRANHLHPPLLGFFRDEYGSPVFRSVLDPPDLIPRDRFSVGRWRRGVVQIVGCRHGLALLFNYSIRELVVWDPVADDRRYVPVPPELDRGEKSVLNCTVLCASAGDDGHVHGGGFRSCRFFKVVFIGAERRNQRIFASVYSSATEDDNVGLAILSYRGFQMWERKVSFGGGAEWVLRKTVNLHDILGLSSVVQREKMDIMGYAEDLNVFFLMVDTGLFMVQIDSMKSKKLSLYDSYNITRCYPFTSFYTSVTFDLFFLVNLENLVMEHVISAVTSEVINRFISFLMNKSSSQEISVDKQLERLQRLLLRVSMVVEEADGRYITNSGMLMQLKVLADAMYRGHNVLDIFRCRTQIQENPINEVSNTFRATKRFCKIVDASWKDKARRPYDTYLYIDNFMFGRHTEKQRLLNFLLEYNPPSVQPAVLPIVGGLAVGKKTLVAHVCADERVQSQFCSVLHLNEDDLLRIAQNCHSLLAGKLLVIVEFVSDVNEMNWQEFYTSLAQMNGGSKVITISRLRKSETVGTVKSIILDNYSYHHMKNCTLAFGSANPNDHPQLVQIAKEFSLQLQLMGTLAGANTIADVLRRNLNINFWLCILKKCITVAEKNISLYGGNPKLLFEQRLSYRHNKLCFVSSCSITCNSLY